MCKLDHRAGKLPIPCETVHLNFSCHSVSYTLGNFEVMLRESSKNDLFTVTIHLIVRDPKNVFFLPLCLSYTVIRPFCERAALVKEESGMQKSDEKGSFFLCKTRFRILLIMI